MLPLRVHVCDLIWALWSVRVTSIRALIDPGTVSPFTCLNVCLLNPGSVWTGLFVYEAVYSCNRPVNLPGEESQMGRFRLWSGGEY